VKKGKKAIKEIKATLARKVKKAIRETKGMLDPKDLKVPKARLAIQEQLARPVPKVM
jgi:hypothetical protein